MHHNKKNIITQIIISKIQTVYIYIHIVFVFFFKLCENNKKHYKMFQT